MTHQNSLIIFSQGSQLLAQADTLQKAKELKSLALTAAEWAKRKKMGEEAIQYCQSYALEAERKMGLMLQETDLCKGGRPRKTSNSTSPVFETQTLKELGLTKRESAEAQLLASVPDEDFEKLKSGKKTRAKVKKENDQRKSLKQMEKAAQSISEDKKQSLSKVFQVIHCSCAELFASSIKPDAVITDPPYPKEFLGVFSELAQACQNVPLVAVMTGQTHLPEVMQRLTEHLHYRWTLAYLTPGGQSVQQFQAKVNTFWKPVLLFGKALKWIGDVCRSEPNDNDKRFHAWGQSESGMADLIEHLTLPGQLICDPFVGGGSTAIASLALKRRFVGCDVDARAVQKTTLRVQSML